MSNAVATIKDVDEYGPIIEWHQHWAELKGHTLYLTQPAQAVDVGAIREVIAELSNPSMLHAPYVTRCADKLTAALAKHTHQEKP